MMDMMDARDAQWNELAATVAALEAKAEASEARMFAAEAKVVALERARRTDRLRSLLSLMIGVVLASVVAMAAAVHAQTSPQTIVCRELRVVSDTGKTRVRLYSAVGADCGIVETYNSTGTSLVSLNYAKTNGIAANGAVATHSSAGKILVGLTADQYGNGGILTYDKDGNPKK